MGTLDVVVLGAKFGRLTVVEAPTRALMKIACRCDCGRVKAIRADNVYRGLVVSCGCAYRDRIQRTHGWSGTATHNAWKSMRSAAARAGIEVEPAWASFDVFLAAVGPRPSDQHRISRYFRERGFVVGNCYWKRTRHHA